MTSAKHQRAVGSEEQTQHAPSVDRAEAPERAAARADEHAPPVPSREGHARGRPNSAQRAAVRAGHPGPAYLLSLQRAVGNQTAGRVLSGAQRKAAPGSPPAGGRAAAASQDAAPSTAAHVTLYFAQNSDQPGAEIDKLERLMLLATDPKCTVRIEGHASTEGTRRYNQSLSERRAGAIQAYLLVMGVDPKQIVSRSYGEMRPAVPEQGSAERTEQSRAQNRRVEVTLTYTGAPNRRLMALQQWLNRTRDRFAQMEQGEMAGLQKAQELLVKRTRLAGKIAPILVYDAERQVSYHEIGLKETRKTLAELSEACLDPEKAQSVLLKRYSYFRRAIEGKVAWRVKSAAALSRAKQALESATNAQEKAFWREVVELYQDSIDRLTEDIFWLTKQQLEEAQTP
ncbi:MAG: OmpA family protein [Anaerolineae bacterium]|nr:OmpA family protein [Anaerolineae bacterium]